MDHTQFLRNFEIFQEFQREVMERINEAIPKAIMTNDFEGIDKELMMLQNATNMVREYSVDHVHKCHVDDELNPKV